MLVIVDYDAGNLRSVVRAVEHVGGSPRVSGDPELVRSAAAVILPGVGSAAQAMPRLRESGLAEALCEVAGRGVPFLGVCLGLQLLMEHSAEGAGGGTACLNLLPGTVRRFPVGPKVPHMGWNTVSQVTAHPIWDGVADDSYFYFVHSYYADAPADVVAGSCDYSLRFCAVLARDNIVATQFHPEKSSTAGLRIYANFLRQAGLCS
jgi:glutamine amidotransferase